MHLRIDEEGKEGGEQREDSVGDREGGTRGGKVEVEMVFK